MASRVFFGHSIVAAVTHTTTGALTGAGSTVAGTSAHIAKHATSGALVGAGATLSGAAARAGNAVTHETTGALVGAGSVVAGAVARLRVMTTSGVLIGPGSVIAGQAIGPASAATTTTGGGIGHGGKKHKKPDIVVVTVDGQDYRVPVNQLQAFLDGIKEEAKKPEEVIKKVAKRKAKKPAKASAPPQVIIKSAPADIMQFVRAQVDRSNEIIASIWAGTLARKVREMEIDEEESIILLLAA